MPVEGEVELLARDKILGWAFDPDVAGSASVEVWLGDQKLRTLRADRPRRIRTGERERIGFRFRIHLSLMKFIHSVDALRFRVSGHELPIRDNLLELMPENRRKPMDELAGKMKDGFIVSKKGKVQLPIHLDEKWQAAVLDWYDEARARFRELFGYDLHVVSGTLLGLVRNGQFIPGDDDFDTGYLSRHSDPSLVRDEMATILKTLVSNGERIRLGKRQNLFHWTSPGGIEIDVFPSWTSGRRYYLTFAIGASCGRAARKGFVERPLHGRPVLTPVDAEAILEGSYGPNWRVPDPLFQWVVPTRTRRQMHRVKLAPEQIDWIWNGGEKPAWMEAQEG